MLWAISFALGSLTLVAATFSDANWLALSSGMDGNVYSLLVSGTNLYAGGSFYWAGSRYAPVAGLARREGTGWLGFGPGLGYTAYAIAVSDTYLYAAGNSIAKWDGISWSSLGSGINDDVYALAVLGSNLYAGGKFTIAGGSNANYIAKWDGNNWTPVGVGMDAPVRALAVVGSDLFAAGSFTNADGNPVNGISRWDGSHWSALGAGVGGDNLSISALAVSGTDLYAGGQFTSAGGATANYVAKWDGNSWSPLGPGMDYWVQALTASGGNLYAGGFFTNAGGITANYIAKWDGTNWSALGSGMNNPVYALAVSDNYLYAGGSFTKAGGKYFQYFARAYLLPIVSLSVCRSAADVIVSWPSTNNSDSTLEHADTLVSNWFTNESIVLDDGTNKSVTVPATNRMEFFRLRGSPPSDNVVGYLTVVPPSNQFICVVNPMTNRNVANTLGNLIGTNLPIYGRVLKWNYAAAHFDIYTRVAFGNGWIPTNGPAATINPGEGFFLVSPVTITNTFVGDVLQGVLTNNLQSGFWLTGSLVPRTNDVLSLGLYLPFSASPYTALLKWNIASQRYDIYYRVLFGSGWSPGIPAIDVGQGFFTRLAGPFTWHQDFIVP